VLFSAAINEFLKALANGRYSGHTLSSYSRTLRDLREFVAASLGHEPEAGEVTNDLMLGHGRERTEQLGRRSMDHRLYTLRSFFRWLNAAHGIEDPLRRIIMPRATYRRLPKVITPEQIAAMIAADVDPDERRGFHDIRDRALLETLYASGCRVAEVVGLNWEDLEGGEPGDVRINGGKGDNDRIVLIGEPARDALEAWHRVAWVTDLGGPIFHNSRGERLTVRAVQLMIDKRAARAGVSEKVHPHLFRHSFATHMMERGAGIADISNLLGHAKLSTTTIYTHTTMAFLQKQLVEHHPRGIVSEPVSPIVNTRAEPSAPQPHGRIRVMSFRANILGEIERVKREGKDAAARLGFKTLSRAWVELEYWGYQRVRSDAVRSRIKCLRALLTISDPIVAVDEGGYFLSEIGAKIDRDLKTLGKQLPKAAPPPPTYLIAQWQKEQEAQSRFR